MRVWDLVFWVLGTGYRMQGLPRPAPSASDTPNAASLSRFGTLRRVQGYGCLGFRV
jgi:hypothetical protein